MSRDSKYYFVFQKKHKLYGYWVEVIGGTLSESKEAFSKRYDISVRRSNAHEERVLRYHPLGCYEKIYLPLPEQVKDFDSEDPFAERKRENFIWAMVGRNSWGKTSFNSVDWKQMMGRVNRKGQINNILILDDYRSIMPSKKSDIHQKINMNAAKATMKKYTKDFKITYKNSEYIFPHIYIKK